VFFRGQFTQVVIKIQLANLIKNGVVCGSNLSLFVTVEISITSSCDVNNGSVT